jgi:hypothetical protein
MEEPQPGAAPIDGAAAVAQPPVDAPAPAGQPQQPNVQTAQPAAQVDDTADWLSKKGIDPTDPEAVMKIAKSYREAEKLALSAAQEASELKKSLAPQGQPSSQDGTQGDPMVQEMYQDWKRDKLVNGFKESHRDWQQYEPVMVEKLHEQVNTPYGVYSRSQLVNAGFMSLEDVYTMAKGSAPMQTEQIQAQAKQEVLQTLANTQRAGGGTAQASNSNPQAQTEDPIAAAIRKARG